MRQPIRVARLPSGSTAWTDLVDVQVHHRVALAVPRAGALEPRAVAHGNRRIAQDEGPAVEAHVDQLGAERLQAHAQVAAHIGRGR